jgi:peptide/nickel transport system permease protein
MVRFLIRRLLLGVLVVWLISMVVFAIFYLDPAGPDAVARRIGGKAATPLILAQIKHRLYLDHSVPAQYGHWVWGLLHGDLGFDYYNSVPVTTIIKQAFPISFWLATGAAILWVSMGVLSGILSAVRPRTLLDRAFTTLALFFYSFPTFVLGLILLLVFYYELTIHHAGFFPPSGYINLTDNPYQWFKHLLLPWVTLAAVTAAAYTRLTRGSMLDVLGEDYIRTARAKGLSERRVVFRHALRAALTPVVTQFGIDLGTLVGGAIITEQVFGLPGLGFTAVHAINSNDLPVIIAITMIAATAIVVANIIVDALYAVLDPRVRLH